MGQACSVLPQHLPKATLNPDLDEDRGFLLKTANGADYNAYLRQLFSGHSTEVQQMYKDTLANDLTFIMELNKLGCITLDSQPGVCTQESSQRAYCNAFMMFDEATDLVDLVNRTDIVATIVPPTQYQKVVQIPMTYMKFMPWMNKAGSMAVRSPRWPGMLVASTYTNFSAETETVPSLFRPMFENPVVVFVHAFDPMPGRPASTHMYPKVLLPIMRAIRRRYTTIT